MVNFRINSRKRAFGNALTSPHHLPINQNPWPAREIRVKPGKGEPIRTQHLTLHQKLPGGNWEISRLGHNIWGSSGICHRLHGKTDPESHLQPTRCLMTCNQDWEKT